MKARCESRFLGDIGLVPQIDIDIFFENPDHCQVENQVEASAETGQLQSVKSSIQP